MQESHPAYRNSQVSIHWIIAALVVFQLIFGEDIKLYGRALRREDGPDTVTFLMGNAHIWVGIAILLLTLIRIFLKLKFGTPEDPPTMTRLMHIASRVVYGLFYLLLIVAPITGALAWFGGFREIGDIHELVKPALIVLIVVHLVAALYHKFVLKDGVMERMLPMLKGPDASDGPAHHSSQA